MVSDIAGMTTLLVLHLDEISCLMYIRYSVLTKQVRLTKNLSLSYATHAIDPRILL